MNIERLRVANLRCFEEMEFAPGPGINWLVGPNGVGKTTLLEAAYILSHGRSFRSGGRAAPCRHGVHDYLIYAEIAGADGSRTRLGLSRSEGRWLARRDGEDVRSLAPLFAACPVVYFGPESQALMLGPAEVRRAFLDWGVFHVEHSSLGLWKAWRRALRQRNALLRQNAVASDFAPWEHDLEQLALKIHALRARCLEALTPYFADEARALVPELGSVEVTYRCGWDEQTGLREQLAAERDRDRDRGFTQRGAHRADWSLVFSTVGHREYLSRGQAKAAALVCTLALTRWLKDAIGGWPLLCLDDLGSELDATHAGRVIDWLGGKSIQGWLTSTQTIDARHHVDGSRVFHVKQTGCEPVGTS